MKHGNCRGFVCLFVFARASSMRELQGFVGSFTSAARALPTHAVFDDDDDWRGFSAINRARPTARHVNANHHPSFRVAGAAWWHLAAVRCGWCGNFLALFSEIARSNVLQGG